MKGCKLRPMLSTYVPWAGRDLYRAVPAMTWDLSRFHGLIRRTALFSHLLQGPTITWILTENSNQKYVITGLFLNFNKYCTNMPVWQAIVTWSQLNFWASFIWYITVSPYTVYTNSLMGRVLYDCLVTVTGTQKAVDFHTLMTPSLDPVMTIHWEDWHRLMSMMMSRCPQGGESGSAAGCRSSLQ